MKTIMIRVVMTMNMVMMIMMTAMLIMMMMLTGIHREVRAVRPDLVRAKNRQPVFTARITRSAACFSPSGATVCYR